MASSTNEPKVKFTAEVGEFNAALKQSRSAMTELSEETLDLPQNMNMLSDAGTDIDIWCHRRLRKL